MDKLKIAVLMGGVSSEREVSLKSGRAVFEALTRAGHDVIAIDLRAEDIAPLDGLTLDAVFPALHGRFGEDGGVQRLLEKRGLPYVGSDPLASRAAMDKMASKCFFISHDIPTPPFRLVTATMRWQQIEDAVGEITLPVIVKPLRQGSSVGVTKAQTLEEVATGLATAFRYGRQALIERCIIGREFTVGVLDGQALPLVELKPRQAFFDYFAKYQDTRTEFIVNPELPPATTAELQRLGVEAHRCLNCRHLSRVDVMLENDGCAYVLEVNTIPGFTERSLFPKAAQASGLDYTTLCDRLVRLAIESARAPRPALQAPNE
ncbi:MAG TPA: D-alanine--D-alanine ligase [Candidatus Brocadiia bacterium]|nr:D-alanine--D-alanine ligase [Candidatus Brocadiia bacterium]